MGNIMLCGSLCNSCEASSETNVEQNNQQQNNQQSRALDQILIKEIFEREKIEKIVDKEINALRNLVDKNDVDIKEKCDECKRNIYRNIAKLENESNQSISQIESHIEKIKDNHLYHIERDINVIRTKVDNTNDDISEIKDVLKEINKTTIKNSTRLDLLKV